jgi:hypothetical protein
MAAISMTSPPTILDSKRPPSPESSTNHKHILWLFLALLGVTLLFVPGMTPSFSADDYPHLVKNIYYQEYLQALSVFMEFDGREYRPIVRFSLWLNYQMGQTAVPFHYTNLLLHIMCTLCLYGILKTLAHASLPAAAASLVFALHPIHTTNIFFIMGRTDLLCALFYLLAVLFFLNYLFHSKRSFLALAFVSFLFSLLSKEMAASLPFMLFAISTLNSEKPWQIRLITASRQTAIFFILLAIYMSIRIYFWSTTLESISGYVSYSVSGIIRNLALSAAGLSYPFDLYQLRNLLETSPGLLVASAVLYGGIALAILAFIVGKNLGKLIGNKLLILGIAWFILTLTPIIGGLAHRWYLYLPSASISLYLLAFWQTAEKRYLLILCLCVVGIISSMEILRQSSTWHRQSMISEAFFLELEEKGLHKQQSFYFANVPFGYESTYLFTFHSLEDAMLLRWGTRPDIIILSYLNLTDGTSTKSNFESDTLLVEMQPDRFSFFLFPVAQRRFSRAGETIRVGNASVTINKLAPSGTVSHYSIDLPSNEKPFFYFDGTAVSRMR